MNAKPSPKRILVVDDEPAIRRSFELILRHLGHEVETAQNGVEALAKTALHKFELVFIDFEMAGMRGDEVAREIKRNHPHLPIVLTTGSASSRVTPDFAGTLKKPFSVTELEQAIEAWSWT